MVPVLAKVGGFVSEVRVDENQHVEKGDALVVLDDSELQQQVDQAEAALAAAQAAVGSNGETGQSEARLEQARRQRAALSARIEAARANLSRAEKDLERTRGLADKEIVSRQQLDAAVAAAEEARAQVSSLEEQRSAAAAGITTAQAGIREAQARLKQARVALEQARLQLSYADIEAPVSGRVSRRSVEPGQLLQPGQALFTIVADAGIFVTANFKETQLHEIHPGQAVEFDVDAYDGCSARGEVESISGATGSQFALIPPDNATGNFTKVVQRVPVRIKVTEDCGAERPLRPGMSVVVDVSTG
jgi:membrane fusion protein (multidrug efflux system)